MRSKWQWVSTTTYSRFFPSFSGRPPLAATGTVSMNSFSVMLVSVGFRTLPVSMMTMSSSKNLR